MLAAIGLPEAILDCVLTSSGESTKFWVRLEEL